MVLGDVVRVKTRALVGLDDLEALAIELLVRAVAEVEVIEDAELHHGPIIFPSSSRRGAAGGGGVVTRKHRTTPALRATPPCPRRGNPFVVPLPSLSPPLRGGVPPEAAGR